MHHLNHAMDVTRVQTDRGFIEHKERIDERCAQRSGQVDPLHLTTRKRAALAV